MNRVGGNNGEGRKAGGASDNASPAPRVVGQGINRYIKQGGRSNIHQNPQFGNRKNSNSDLANPPDGHRWRTQRWNGRENSQTSHANYVRKWGDCSANTVAKQEDCSSHPLAKQGDCSASTTKQGDCSANTMTKWEDCSANPLTTQGDCSGNTLTKQGDCSANTVAKQGDCFLLRGAPHDIHRQHENVGSGVALPTGTLVSINDDRHHGFLRLPRNCNGLPVDAFAVSQRDVLLQLKSSSTLTGLMEPQPGDVFEFACDGSSERPRAFFARLITCTPRSPSSLSHYLNTLLTTCQGGDPSSSLTTMHQQAEAEEEVEGNDPCTVFTLLTACTPSSYTTLVHSFQSLFKRPKLEEKSHQPSPLPVKPQQEAKLAIAPAKEKEEKEEKEENGGEIVLREITKCPIGILLALQQPQPCLNIVKALLELTVSLSNFSTRLYTVQLRIFHKLFHASQFLLSPHALLKYIRDHAQDTYGVDGNNNNTGLIRPFLLTLAKSSPDIVPSLVPLVHMSASAQRNTAGDAEFFLELFTIASYDKGEASNLYWDRTPIIPLHGELHPNAITPGQQNQFIGLPLVIKTGSYGSAENYIETYFRLLREDCFGNLKNGIRDFQAGKLKKGDMKVWLNVHVIGVHFERTTPGMTIALRCETSGPGNLPNQGSLLCVLCDGGKLKSPIWARVRNRGVTEKNIAVCFVDVIEMKEGNNSAFVKLITFGGSIILLESPAHFRAYEPVLRSLQAVDPKRLAFQEEIVHGQWPSLAPDYLLKSTSLDWKCVVKEAGIERKELRAGVYEFDRLVQQGFQTMLNESQKEALTHVLKSRLAMIQGPPGTGKTFLASKVLELILSANAFPNKPILIVTYKNQALDILLEKCTQFCGSPGCVVRVGRCSSFGKLEEASLIKILSKSIDSYQSDWKQNSKRLEEIQRNMQAVLQTLKACLSVDIHFSCNWLASAPEQFIYKLLSQRLHDGNLLQQLPEETSLSKFLFERPLVNSEISKQLHKVMLDTLKDWLPGKVVLRQVHQSLLSLRGLVALSEVDVLTNDEGIKESESGDLEDDNEEDEESISELLQQDNASEKGKKNNSIEDWLASDFVTVTVQKNDMMFFSFGLEDLDSGLEQNLLFWTDPWKLSLEQRFIVVQMILKRNLEDVSRKVNAIKEEYNKLCCLNEEIAKRRKLEALKNAKIIGMTTTDVAMHQDIINILAPSVILVEEAAEILEPHIIALMNPGLQHLILIGDHYQLRPKVECSELEKFYGFGVSMFERLTKYNKLPFQTLNVQSRMRAEFLPLLRPIYPALESNLECVSGIRNQTPRCMINSMFFWTHSFEENKQKVVQNSGEANMVIALTMWLVAEGNESKNITVLAAYNGQVSLIRKKMRTLPGLEDVGVFTIDEFQGLENHIVIVSLVRSNDECKIGYLTHNRLCLAVSRARGGLYICGNPKTLSRSPHWIQFIKYFNENKCIGDIIFLKCPRHPASSPPLSLSSQEACSFSPNLCQQRCLASLHGCHHLCAEQCHTGEHVKCKGMLMMHVFQDCLHRTTRLCTQDPKKLQCTEKIHIRLGKCGHTKNCECWELKNCRTLKCDVQCTKTLGCGHPCFLPCFEKCDSKPCATCQMEASIKAAKERELARQEMEEKRHEIDLKLQQLKSEGAGLDVKELGTCDSLWEYNMVKDRFEKYIQDAHQFYPVITKIEVVRNPNLMKKFLNANWGMIDPTKPHQMLFHGTSHEAIAKIVRDGFNLPPEENKNMYGRGIYFATDSSKSAQLMYTKGSRKILLCEVLVGKALCLNKEEPGLNLEIIRGRFYDSVYSQRNSKKTGGTLFDEYVIYNPGQAYPKYIISFNQMDRLSPKFPLLNLRHDTTVAEFARISLKPSADLSSNDANEHYFRFAESQFLRMQSDHKKRKVTEVEVIHNRKLEARYEAEKQALLATPWGKNAKERLVFHGTTKEAAQKIVREGFKVGGDGVPIRCGDAHGRGVYTAAKPDTSLHYAAGTGMVLLCKAVLVREGVDYKTVQDDVYVLKNVVQLLPLYIIHTSI